MTGENRLNRIGLSRTGVRTRATVVAVVVLALALATLGILLVVLLNWSLSNATTDSARSSGKQVANQIVREGAKELSESDVASTGDAEAVIQVLDRTGQPVAADPSISGRGPLTPARPAPGHEIVETVRLTVNDTEQSYRLVTSGVNGPGGPFTIISARSLEYVSAASVRLTLLLGTAALPLLVIAALAVHRAVGSALRPVEEMRRTVADLSARDLTSRVPLPAPQDEIRRLATTLNGMLDRLGSAQQAQRRFVADASHELRSPLSTITTALEVSEHHPEAMPRAELVGVVSRETARLRELVDDLLVLARTDDTTESPARTETDLDDLARIEADRVHTANGLHVELDARPAKVRGTPAQLQRAIRNLVDNARDHARARIRISTGTANGVATVEVSDDGPGVPEADRLRVFERFVRLDDSRQRRVGASTGLGLAIVAGIAARHGGRAYYVPRDEPGACFRLELPADGEG
ncbi:sensor histidine kinase [Amycolatopsis acidicola]|uniref:sensor histidine kinase n=1 Tax=Amycolatopsis acidicola TaxID=2596893 RepID=UPI001FB6278D|nr:HAMP domain-containing sensor histidine kinase [Amycolatopsis acidicola]